jgi:hypothetical protein
MARSNPVYIQAFSPNRDDSISDKSLRATLPMTKWMEIMTNNVDALAGYIPPLLSQIKALEARISTLEMMLSP